MLPPLNAGLVRFLVSVFAVALVSFSAVPTFAGEAAPRSDEELAGYPPIIEITKPSTDTVFSQTSEIRLDYWRDPQCDVFVFPGQPDPCEPDESTLDVWVNGQLKSSYFTTHGGWANSTSVTMTDNAWNTIRGKICNPYGCDEDTVQVYVESKPAPVVSLLPTDDQVLDRGLCASFPAGPATAWSCDEWLISHSTIPYYAIGSPRSVSLVYSSQVAYPHIPIRADVKFRRESTVPDDFSVKLWLNGSDHGREIFYSTSGLNTSTSADQRRAVLPLNAEGLAPGRHSLKFIATSTYGTTGKTGVDSIGFAWDTVWATTISRGWAIPGLARVVQDGNQLIWSDGAGTVHYYLGGPTTFWRIEGVLAEMKKVQESSQRTWRRLLPSGAAEYYDNAGRLSLIVPLNPADSTVFQYTGGGKIRAILDASGDSIRFRYNGSGRLRAIVYPDSAAGRDSTRLVYDGSNRLYRIFDPDGKYTQFSYSGSSYRITARKDRSGATTNYVWYGHTPKVRRTTLPVGGDSIVYRAPQLAGLADTTVSGLSSGNPAPTPPQVSEAEGSIRNARGYTSTFKVNAFGSLLEFVDALGRTTTYERNEHSQVTSRVGPDGVEFWWRYVPDLGMLAATNDVNADSAINYEYPKEWVSGQWEYCTDGGYPCLVEKEVRFRGPGLGSQTTEYEYTGNRVRKAIHPGGDSTVYEYSNHCIIMGYSGECGQVSKITTPLGRKQRFEYDGPTGRLLRTFKYSSELVFFGDTTYAGATDSVSYFYDGKGRVRRVTEDPTSGSYPYGRAYTETEYDPIGRVTKSTRVRADTTPQIQHSVTYTYDDANRKLTVTDPKSQSQVFTHDALGRVTRRDDPAGAYETFTYDGNGNLLSWRTRRGDTISYSYDALDRVVSKAVPGTGTTTYGYHTLRGTLDTIITPDARNYREFDARGRITLDSSWVSGLSGDGYAIRYAYDYQGNLDTLIDHTGNVWTYDPTANPVPFGTGFRYSASRWEDFLSDTTEWTYDEDGRLTEIAFHNGVRDTLGYDIAGRITRWQDATYVRGARGGRISQMDAPDLFGNRRVKYTYDFKGQLIQERDSLPGQAPVVRTYAYDAAGNRTGSGYRYDSANRLMATPTDTFTYDAAGNLTWWKEKSTGKYKTLTWDAEGALAAVNLYDSGGGNPYRTASFTYDGTGRRVKKVVTGDQTDTVRYVWDGSEVLEEIGAGRRYTPHPNNVDATLSVSDSGAGGLFYFHRDASGSVTSVTDSSGSTVSRYRYEAFGNRTALGAEGYTSDIGWQGREFDSETGLYYFRARYYVAKIGRFISEDQVGDGSRNRYMFAENDPLTHRDPFGLCIEDDEECWKIVRWLEQQEDSIFHQAAQYLREYTDGYVMFVSPCDSRLNVHGFNCNAGYFPGSYQGGRVESGLFGNPGDIYIAHWPWEGDRYVSAVHEAWHAGGLGERDARSAEESAYHALPPNLQEDSFLFRRRYGGG